MSNSKKTSKEILKTEKEISQLEYDMTRSGMTGKGMDKMKALQEKRKSLIMKLLKGE